MGLGLCLGLGLAFLFGALSGWAAQHVHQDTQWQQAVKQQGEESAQQGALGVGGLGQGHHDGDVKPSDRN